MEPGPGPGADPEPGPGTDPAADPDVEPLHRGGFRCRLCQITAANRPSLRSHLAGRRHRRLRWLRAERRAQERRSLFVSGFARGTEPARLRQHFRAFGDVATVVMDKEKGAFAIVELREPAARQRALDEPRHELGGRRLRVRPREHREFPRPPPRDPPPGPPGPPGLLQALGRAPDVGAQLQLLVRALELSAAERRLRELLLALIREVFTEFFPGCSVVPYGSSVNGFDVHGCDLDLHLELGGGDGDPPSQGTPDGDPQIQGTPDGDPQIQGTPNGDPQIQETPNGDPQIQETPNGDPQIQGTLNGDPPSQGTLNGDPQIQGNPNGDGAPPPNGSFWGDKEPPLQRSFLGSDRSLLGDREPPLESNSLGDREDPSSRGSVLGSEGSHEGSLLGSKGSILGSEGSLLGSEGSREGSLLGDKGSLLGSEGSHLGSEGSHLGSEGSLLGDKGSLLGSEGSHLGSEGSHLGSEGSLLGDRAPSLEGSLLGDDPSPPARSPLGSWGSLSGDESPEAEGSPLGCGGSLLGRGAPPERALALVGAVLRRCVPGVRGVRPVPGARRPVVKFSHKQSGLAGDVCLDNRLALFNTRFLRLCAELDPRVRPLGYAVRLWAGGQRLAGNRAGGGPLLTNYALTLLVVLFLQSRSPPVLPSVRRLRHLAGPQDRAQVGGWDCSFPRDAAGLERSENGQSAASLLAEFFSYFGTLDLGGLLLSPLEGRALPRPPPETLGGLRPGPLTLQDPFELSHNVAANVTARTVSRFVRCCRDAARLCRGPEFLQKSRRGRPWGVMRLLRPGPGAGPGDPRGKFLIPIPLPAPGGAGGVPQAEVCAAVAFVLSEVLGCGCEPRGARGAPGQRGTPGESPPGARCHLEGVTGDSPGEFGERGTPGESPPGAGCHLEKVTGDSQEEFGERGTPGESPPGARCHLEKVTGDSQEEFGERGTPGESPPGAGCHLEKVTGDSRGEFGERGTPGESPPGAGCHLEGVTGDSRGEFGERGTPGESPPGARCHLEKVTGDSRGEFGERGTPGESPPGAGCHLEKVTGDSQEEFGERGTPGESPPGARCHLEKVTGDSPGEFGELGTPGESPPGAGCHLEGVTGDSPGEFGELGTPGESPPGAGCHLEKVTGDSQEEFGELGTPGESPPGAGCHLEKVTGDSWGGFGERGTPGESPPGAGCHLEKVTGDSRGGFGDAGTPGPGWKRRPPEGVPNGAGVPPAKRPRLLPVPSRWSCCVRYRVWRGRRRLRRRLRPGGGTQGNRGGPEGSGGAPAAGDLWGVGNSGGCPDLGGSPLALERAVTEAIVRGDAGAPPGPPPEPLLRFQLSAHRGGSRRDPQMLLHLQPEPDPPSPLFQEFFHFLRGFLPGMVRQRLGWGAGGAGTPEGGGFVNPEVFQ